MTLLPTDPPLIDVVMPVFNAEPFLDVAIRSILAQTHHPLRLLICDDQSTDGSYQTACHWASRDPRIVVQRNQARLGPVGNSNAAAAMANTIFVARMDADDVAMPDRLARQLALMIAHPDCPLVGSMFAMIDQTGTIMRTVTLRKIRGQISTFAHASMFYRRSSFEQAGGYLAGTEYFEDIDLYRRMRLLGPVLVINAPLIHVRFAGQHARLRDDAGKVEDAVNLYHAAGPIDMTVERRIAPDVFFMLA
ncbi:MAG: hypothetical protein RL367_1281, partial [Pseudomonadota bacterium]